MLARPGGRHGGTVDSIDYPVIFYQKFWPILFQRSTTHSLVAAANPKTFKLQSVVLYRRGKQASLRASVASALNSCSRLVNLLACNQVEVVLVMESALTKTSISQSTVPPTSVPGKIALPPQQAGKSHILGKKTISGTPILISVTRHSQCWNCRSLSHHSSVQKRRKS